MGHKEIEVQREIYNITTDTYHTWASDGELIDLTPFHFALPRFPSGKRVYIVNKETYKKAKKNNRPTEDLVYAEDYGKTFSDVNLSKIVMYDNKKVRVYPIKGVI